MKWRSTEERKRKEGNIQNYKKNNKLIRKEVRQQKTIKNRNV